MGQLITINDRNYHQFVQGGSEAVGRRHGQVPRDWKRHAYGSLPFAPKFDLPMFDEAEWPERIKEQEAKQSSLQHIRDIGDSGKPIAALDQNGQGYCWAYSTTGCVQMVRAVMGLPYVPLSAHMVACIIKGYQDEGGNGIDSLEFIVKNGVCSQQFWPQDSMDEGNDTPAMRANAKQHIITEWMDCSDDADIRRKQVATALLLGFPVVADYDWWSHSIMLIRLMSKTKTRLLNSWSNEWSDNGVGDIEDDKAWPDAAWVLRVITAGVV